METSSFQLFHSCGGGASTAAAVVVVDGVQVLAGVAPAPAAPSHHNFVRGGLLWRPSLFHSDNLDAATRGRLEQSLDRLVLNVMHRRTLLSPVHMQAGERLANIVVGR